MGEIDTDDLVDELALRLATLIARPADASARAAARRSHAMWRAWKARHRLPAAAADADAEARRRPGYRADLDG